MNSIKIIVAEDHKLVREGFKSLLSKIADFELVGEAENGLQLLDLIDKVTPDVLLVDISMPELGGLEAIEKIRKINPNLRPIILTMHQEPDYIMKAVQNGAQGYLFKNVELDELETAIRTVAKGGKYYNQTVSNIMIEGFSKHEEKNGEQTELTAREKEILQYVADGMSTKIIADKLSLSPRTVETHRVHIMKKLNVSNSAEMVKKAIELKIIK